MSKRPPEESPVFSSPPVVESAMSVQFDELPGFDTVHFGMFRDKVVNEFPLHETQPRLGSIVERFPFRSSGKFRFQQGVTPERVYYLNGEGTRLLQLQANRFGLNWRSQGKEGVKYPTYAENSRTFFKYFDALKHFCEQNELGDFRPGLCEVLYVNNVLPLKGESFAELFAKVLSLSVGGHTDWLPPVETATFNRTFVIGEQEGRLYVEAGVSAKDNQQSLVLKLVARIYHKDERSLRETMDLSHDWVVQAFVAFTNPEIRSSRWGEQ
jgi:uncharacterized protein (TIGR04255 family)